MKSLSRYVTLSIFLLSFSILPSLAFGQSLSRTQNLRCLIQPVLFFLHTPTYCIDTPVAVTPRAPQKTVSAGSPVSSVHTSTTTTTSATTTQSVKSTPRILGTTQTTQTLDIAKLVNTLVEAKFAEFKKQTGRTYTQTEFSQALQDQADAVTRSSGQSVQSTLSSGNTNISGNVLSGSTVTVSDLLIASNTAISTITPTNGVLTVNGAISNLLNANVPLQTISSTNVGGSFGLDVIGNYAYISGGNFLKVFDITNPRLPVQVGSTTVPSASNLVASGRYVYVTSYFNTNRLNVVDVSNPSNPVIVGYVGMQNSARSLTISGKYVYVVPQNGNAIAVVDVSNPTAPVTVGSVSIGAASFWQQNGLVVQKGYIYHVSASQDNLRIIDATDPAQPVTVSTTSITDANAVTVSGRYAYITGNAGDILYIYDVSNPSAPQLVKTTTGLGVGEKTLAVSGRYLAVVSRNANTLTLYDVADVTNPVVVGTTSVPGSPVDALVFAGKYIYVGALASNLNIIEIPGIESSSALIHSLESGTLMVNNDSTLAGNLTVGNSLLVGIGGILSQGPISVDVASSTSTSTAGMMSAYFKGYVGIGTTTPSAKLSITGNGTGLGKVFALADSNNSEKLSVTDSGLLSLAGGINMPSESLINFTGTYGNPATTTWYLGDVLSPVGANINTNRALTMSLFGSGNQGFLIRNEANTSLLEINGDGTKAYIKANLGLGTVNSDEGALKVAGSIYSTADETDSVLNGSVPGWQNKANFIGTGAWWGMRTATDHSFNIDMLNSNALSVKQDGNVGIGTTTPGSKLTVSGDISATGNVVANQSILTGGALYLTSPANSGKNWGMSYRSDRSLLFYAYNTDNYYDYYGFANNLYLTENGKMGLRTSAPGSTLSVGGSAGNGLAGQGNVSIGLSYATIAAPVNGLIVQGSVGIGTSNPTLGPLVMASGAYVTSGGTWTNASDRNLKENFKDVDGQDILNKISELPITQWNYKSESATTTHIGPMAQDFFRIFNLGGSDTSISTIDPSGLALVGVQTLNSNLNALLESSTTVFMQASSTATSTAQSANFAIKFFNGLFTRISDWLGSVGNGIHDLFVGTSHQKTLCVGEPGDETCITKSQLDALIQGPGHTTVSSPQVNVPQHTNTSTTTDSSSNTAESTTTGITEPTPEPVVTPDPTPVQDSVVPPVSESGV